MQLLLIAAVTNSPTAATNRERMGEFIPILTALGLSLFNSRATLAAEIRRLEGLKGVFEPLDTMSVAPYCRDPVDQPSEKTPKPRSTNQVVRDLGVQPLDGLMTRLEIDNHALVASSKEHLTHKMVARGRKGRRLTWNVQDKICNAMNAALKAKDLKPIAVKDLFNYCSRARKDWSSTCASPEDC